jgi:hypothetical protein
MDFDIFQSCSPFKNIFKVIATLTSFLRLHNIEIKKCIL